MSVIGTQDSTMKPKSMWKKICCKVKTKKISDGGIDYLVKQETRKSPKYLKKKNQ